MIVGGFVFGPKGGMLMGFFFGLTSFIRCFTTPDATAAIVLGTGTGFGPYNLLLIIAVLFLPRILTGLFSALLYRGLRKSCKDVLAMGVAAFGGSLTNTVFYLGGLYVLAFSQTAEAMGVAGENAASALLKVLLGVVALNGILEALAAVIIACAVGKALMLVLQRARKK